MKAKVEKVHGLYSILLRLVLVSWWAPMIFLSYISAWGNLLYCKSVKWRKSKNGLFVVIQQQIQRSRPISICDFSIVDVSAWKFPTVIWHNYGSLFILVHVKCFNKCVKFAYRHINDWCVHGISLYLGWGVGVVTGLKLVRCLNSRSTHASQHETSPELLWPHIRLLHVMLSCFHAVLLTFNAFVKLHHEGQ